MKRLALLLVAALAFASVSVGAQTPGPRLVTPTPTATPAPDLDVFQPVVVAGWEYSVDPFFPCSATLIARVTRLEPEIGVQTMVTFQPFYRSGEEMLAGEAFTTVESEITEDLVVGQAMTCQPQVPVETP